MGDDKGVLFGVYSGYNRYCMDILISAIRRFFFAKGHGNLMRLKDDLEKNNGFTFTITSSNEGWLAECEEIPGIVTGSDSPKPTMKEVTDLVKDAIFSAYAIPRFLCDNRILQSEHEKMKNIKRDLENVRKERVVFDTDFAYSL